MGAGRDRHTDLINWICSTFSVKLSGYLALKHKYDEFRPEPEVKILDGRTKTPDIIAVNNEKQVVLIIECKGGLDTQLSERFYGKFDPEKTRKQINDYSTILHDSLIEYFPNLKTLEMDIIIAIYPDFLVHLEKIRDKIDVKKRALWEFNEEEKNIYKTLGDHTDISLDESLSRGVPVSFHHPPPIVWFSRHSNKDHVAAEGLIKLLLHAVYRSDFDFNIEKIDRILNETTQPPLLWQLNKEERHERWRYMVSKSIRNKWMKEVKPDVYRFLNIHTHRELDDNITSRSFDTMVRKIREGCGLHD